MQSYFALGRTDPSTGPCSEACQQLSPERATDDCVEFDSPIAAAARTIARVPDRPHHLPASFIGGFGQPDVRAPLLLRIARVCVRRKDPDKLLPSVKAERIGFEYGIYDVDAPDADLPADYAETEWRKYESKLPRAIRAFDSGTAGPGDWQAILLHLRATWARHPDFARDVGDQKAAQGVIGLTSDDVQRLRKQVLADTSVMSGCRFALLRRGPGAPRFLTDDKGFTPIGEPGRPPGVLFPLSGALAVLMALGTAQPGDDYGQGPYADRTVNAKGAEILNAATWDHVGIRCVIGHPDDVAYIGSLRDHDRELRVKIRYGPYRGNREPGFFDWS